jgi:hypothetical protein
VSRSIGVRALGVCKEPSIFVNANPDARAKMEVAGGAREHGEKREQRAKNPSTMRPAQNAGGDATNRAEMDRIASLTRSPKDGLTHPSMQRGQSGEVSGAAASPPFGPLQAQTDVAKVWGTESRRHSNGWWDSQLAVNKRQHPITNAASSERWNSRACRSLPRRSLRSIPPSSEAFPCGCLSPRATRTERSVKSRQATEFTVHSPIC